MPKWDTPSAEMIKIDNMFRAYESESQLFIQKDTGAVILKLSGDVIISGKCEAEEVNEFLSFLKPQSVFSSEENMSTLYGAGGYELVNVLIRENCPVTRGNLFSCDFSSSEAYDLLNTEDFFLPPYEYFATDYCRRKNMGLIKVFGKHDTCIAVTLESENYRLINGIKSRVKGMGGALLLSAISGEKSVLAVCRDKLIPFYTKLGFKPLNKAGYWRKYI